MPLLCAYLFLDAKLLIICITAKFFDAKCAACRFCLALLRGRFCVAGRCWGCVVASFCGFVAGVFCLRCCVVVSLCRCRVLLVLLRRFVAVVFWLRCRVALSQVCFGCVVVSLCRCRVLAALLRRFVAVVRAAVLFPYKYLVPIVILVPLFPLFFSILSSPSFPSFHLSSSLQNKKIPTTHAIASSGRAVPQ